MFGSDGSPIVQYVVIFAVIFAALAAIVFTVRRLTGRSLALPSRGGRGRQPRLGIVDVYELDRARQLILLRRDNVEHLLLVGGPNDVVVERNIQRTQRPLTEPALRPELAADGQDEPLPDPLVEGGRLPEPPRALPELAGLRAEPLFDPGFTMPVVVPPPVPRSPAGPAVTLPLDAALLGGDEPGQDISAPLSPGPTGPPAVQAPPAREPINPRRILSRTAPPLAEVRSGPASERGADAAPIASEPSPAPSLPVPSERRTVDPAVLSDMARQLQAALSRPSSAVTPAPATLASAATSDGVDPIAAGMASVTPAPPPVAAPPDPVTPSASNTPPAPVTPPTPVTPPPVVAPPAVEPPAPAVIPAEPPASRDPVAPAPAPVPPPAAQPAMPKAAPAFQAAPPPVAPPPAPPPTAPEAAEAPSAVPAAPAPSPRPEPKASGNPFSVEEIEAEFARLLGRPLDKRG
ncbi:hypothetical protein [Methylobacterium sp. J-070]|uniref:hypothetical protein n=1 Tax=Methylobacterium sp. J-070 TaxID=2836650 RepID=UPI001FBAED48|nr:hypothetical protein [Methylobacterium sp. J-070]MCJ2049105.1 hypothetical protein [Methylobacterium sp. J-070]